MRAVNLIPPDRRGGRGSAPGGGRSNGAVYVLLGTLALLVVMVAGSALLSRGMAAKRADLVRLKAETARAQAHTGRMSAYNQMATLRRTRVETVGSLARSRVDWAALLHNLAVVLPRDAWLSSLTATVTPGVPVAGGGGGQTGGLRAALPVPAFEIVGCTTSQSQVAELLTKLRAMPRVLRVSLADSQKSDQQTGGAQSDSASSDADCRHASSRFPQFSAVVFFRAPATPAAGSGGTAPAAATSTAPSAPSTGAAR